MNKKLIGAILCVSIITIGAIPAMGLSDAAQVNDVVENEKPDTHVVAPAAEGQANLTVCIKRGLSRGVTVNIKNTGDANASNVNWSLKVTRRGLIKRTLLDASGNFSMIENGSMETVTEMPSFGFCLIIVSVKVEADGIESITKSAKGFIVFRFTRLRRFF